MKTVTFVLLDEIELGLCRACPYIASANGKDACYKEDYVDCPHLKEYKERLVNRGIKIGKERRMNYVNEF